MAYQLIPTESGSCGDNFPRHMVDDWIAKGTFHSMQDLSVIEVLKLLLWRNHKRKTSHISPENEFTVEFEPQATIYSACSITHSQNQELSNFIPSNMRLPTYLVPCLILLATSLAHPLTKGRMSYSVGSWFDVDKNRQIGCR